MVEWLEQGQHINISFLAHSRESAGKLFSKVLAFCIIQDRKLEFSCQRPFVARWNFHSTLVSDSTRPLAFRQRQEQRGCPTQRRWTFSDRPIQFISIGFVRLIDDSGCYSRNVGIFSSVCNGIGRDVKIQFSQPRLDLFPCPVHYVTS